jgi:hypothetical protein
MSVKCERYTLGCDLKGDDKKCQMWRLVQVNEEGGKKGQRGPRKEFSSPKTIFQVV